MLKKGFFPLLLCLIAYAAILTINLDKSGAAIPNDRDEIKDAVPKDSIPAIKDPEFVPASMSGLDNNEPVIGISINGKAHAYSIYLLNHHEIVNDKIGDIEFVVAWCPLANLAVVYSRVIEGQAYDFGVSGKLLKNTLVMFDYETESLWPIVYGEALEGKLKGKKLEKILNCQIMPWGKWKDLNPETIVLSYQGKRTVGFDAYGNYHKSEEAGIHPVGNNDKRLNSKSNIIGVEVRGKYKAYPFSTFDDRKIITDKFNGMKLLIYRNKQNGFVQVYDLSVEGKIINLEGNANQDFVDDGITATTWDLRKGAGIKGKMKGTSLRRISFMALYWYVWADYYPDTEIFIAIN